MRKHRPQLLERRANLGILWLAVSHKNTQITLYEENEAYRRYRRSRVPTSLHQFRNITVLLI